MKTKRINEHTERMHITFSLDNFDAEINRERGELIIDVGTMPIDRQSLIDYIEQFDFDQTTRERVYDNITIMLEREQVASFLISQIKH